MRRSQKNMSIRLAVVDGKKVEDTFSRIGNKGQRAFERIERSSASTFEYGTHAR